METDYHFQISTSETCTAHEDSIKVTKALLDTISGDWEGQDFE